MYLGEEQAEYSSTAVAAAVVVVVALRLQELQGTLRCMTGAAVDYDLCSLSIAAAVVFVRLGQEQ
jgi:hypothetical protein